MRAKRAVGSVCCGGCRHHGAPCLVTRHPLSDTPIMRAKYGNSIIQPQFSDAQAEGTNSQEFEASVKACDQTLKQYRQAVVAAGVCYGIRMHEAAEHAGFLSRCHPLKL